MKPEHYLEVISFIPIQMYYYPLYLLVVHEQGVQGKFGRVGKDKFIRVYRDPIQVTQHEVAQKGAPLEHKMPTVLFKGLLTLDDLACHNS